MDQMRVKAESALIKEYMNRFHADDYVVRDLLPATDLVITGATAGLVDIWNTQALAAVTPLVFVNRVLPDNQLVAVYGVAIMDAAPQTRSITLMRGLATTLAIWNLQELLASQTTRAMTDEAIIWHPQDTIRILCLPLAANAAGDYLSLMGLLCEPKGQTLTK
jgi:hypothetical protein